MAKISEADRIEKLRQHHKDAASAAAKTLSDAMMAADEAAATGSGDARKHFRKQAAKVLKAYKSWQQAAENLAERLKARKPGS
jgi:hypothetical protein